MKPLLLIALLFATIFTASAQQRYFTKTGTISFEAGTSVEDIDGVNKAVTSVFDASTGQIEFAVLIKGFEFKRALMQEHFNENYMESDKFPKAVFKGTITNLDKINFKKEGTYAATVKGILDMHGVKKETEASGNFRVTGETIQGTATFTIVLADFGISIPGVVKDKISKTVKIQVNCNYTPLK
jgi:polyisoprenoid-binding protein YceI